MTNDTLLCVRRALSQKICVFVFTHGILIVMWVCETFCLLAYEWDILPYWYILEINHLIHNSLFYLKYVIYNIDQNLDTPLQHPLMTSLFRLVTFHSNLHDLLVIIDIIFPDTDNFVFSVREKVLAISFTQMREVKFISLKNDLDVYQGQCVGTHHHHVRIHQAFQNMHSAQVNLHRTPPPPPPGHT